MQIKMKQEKKPKQKLKIRQDLSPQQIREIRLSIREECNLKERSLWQEYGKENRHGFYEWIDCQEGRDRGRVKRKLPTSDEAFGSYE